MGVCVFPPLPPPPPPPVGCAVIVLFVLGGRGVLVAGGMGVVGQSVMVTVIVVGGSGVGLSVCGGWVGLSVCGGSSVEVGSSV